uniref:Uncharacterized protein n=1 Tax=Arabidopsis thaliana TaxID=3702 RepID=Q56ZK7_ARATH|nr:hypothetical protein [Arabidopsis thaliana]
MFMSLSFCVSSFLVGLWQL